MRVYRNLARGSRLSHAIASHSHSFHLSRNILRPSMPLNSGVWPFSVLATVTETH